MRSERGITLIEATLVLAVVATLAAILAPGMNGYIEQARQTRVRADASAIGDAVQQFITDTAEHQFFADGNGTAAGVPPTRGDSGRIDLLISDGDVPPLSTAMAGEQIWAMPPDNAFVDTLSNHLVENTPASATANRYRTPSDIIVGAPGGNNIDFARSSSAGFNAPHAWRGPYLRGPVAADPWGNRYAVNVIFLDPAATQANSTFANSSSFANFPRYDVFVMSAGADEEIDTLAAQDGAVPGDDDVIEIVSSHAK